MKYLQKAVASVLAVALAAELASCSVILIDPKDTQTAAGTVAVSGYAGGEAAGGGTSASAAPDSLPDGAEGRFSSDSSARLRLLLDYTRTAGTDGTDSLKLTVLLSSYSLEVSERQNLGRLTCGQESVTFSTDRMTITDNTRVTETVLFSHTVKVPSGEAVGVSASWLFNGVYAGVELGELTVSGTVPAR